MEAATRVAIAHVRYRHGGGEDAVFAHELDLLRRAGVTVEPLELHSADLDRLPATTRLSLVARYADHGYGRSAVDRLVRRFRPDVVHFHNLYPLLGPGAIAEAARLRCATVHTLHNFRLSCLNGLHFRSGEVCDMCRPCRFLPGISRGCYRSSRPQSVPAAWAACTEWNAFARDGHPTLLFALTSFARDRYVRDGAVAARVVVKPNSIPGPAGPFPPAGQRHGVVAAGRLTPEKGIVQLMRAWPAELPTLTVAGDGPLSAAAEAAAGGNVDYVGRLSPDDFRGLLRQARVLVLPSLCYEALPLVALEALAEGTPVVGFAGGTLASLSLPRPAGAGAPRGDFRALSKAAADIHATTAWERLSAECRAVWRARYSDEVNVRALLRHYARAVELAPHLQPRGRRFP